MFSQCLYVSLGSTIRQPFSFFFPLQFVLRIFFFFLCVFSRSSTCVNQVWDLYCARRPPIHANPPAPQRWGDVEKGKKEKKIIKRFRKITEKKNVSNAHSKKKKKKKENAAHYTLWIMFCSFPEGVGTHAYIYIYIGKQLATVFCVYFIVSLIYFLRVKTKLATCDYNNFFFLNQNTSRFACFA